MSTSPWPSTTERDPAGQIVLGGIALPELAERFGTPLWVVDEADLRERCRAYRATFNDIDIYYAAKAWCNVAVVQIVLQEGLRIFVASGGELQTVSRARAPMEEVAFHGNNKSNDELELAAELGVGRIVVDSFDELERAEEVGRRAGHVFSCWLRITPGIDAHTHDYVKTGHDDTKFGFTLSLGLADEALAVAQQLDHVEVVGAHAHVGSQIFGTAPFAANAGTMIDLLAHWRQRFGVELRELNVGGGMAIRYTHEDHPVQIDSYADAIREEVTAACRRHDYPRPRLGVEPGRGVIGPSTVTLYQIGTVKHLPGIRTYLSVDGGMSDNIRPALYEAEHEVALANRAGADEQEAFTVVGKHCESGDLIRARAALPADVSTGDLLAVAATGAYTASMSSNYNRLPRPGAVLVGEGRAREILRRETYKDVLARDVPLD